MNEDPLKALGRLARSSRPAEPDARWDGVTDGSLSAEARAALLETPGAAELAPAFEPLGAEDAEAATRRVLEARRGAELIPFPSRRVRAMAAGIALAAAVLLAVNLPGPASELPTYRVEVSGGDRAERGEAALGTPRLSPGGRLELVARPEVEVVEPVTATARVIPARGPAVAWSAPIDVSPTGSVRLSATVGGDLSLPTGDAVIEVTVTRADGATTTMSVPVVVVE